MHDVHQWVIVLHCDQVFQVEKSGHLRGSQGQHIESGDGKNMLCLTTKAYVESNDINYRSLRTSSILRTPYISHEL